MAVDIKRFLVTNYRGSSFRLLDLDEQKQYRALEREYPQLLVGMLLHAKEVQIEKTLIRAMRIDSMVAGDSNKPRLQVAIEKYQLGDLIDGVPILSFGRHFYVNGEVNAYAYFTPKPTSIK